MGKKRDDLVEEYPAEEGMLPEPVQEPAQLEALPLDPLSVALDKLKHPTTRDVHDRLAALQAVVLALAEKINGNK